MSVDGADLGITAEDGMKAAMGADQDEMVRRTPAELRVAIEAHQENDYEGTANRMALVVLRLFEQRPETRDWPAELQGAFFWEEDAPELDGVAGERFPDSWSREHPDQEMPMDKIAFKPIDDRDLYSAVKAIATPDELEAFEGCSGFQYGWAVNAAKTIVGEPPVANPAIVTIDT